MDKTHIYLIENNPALREKITALFDKAQYEFSLFKTLRAMLAQPPDSSEIESVIVNENTLNDSDYEHFKELNSGVPSYSLVCISHNDSADLAVRALNSGMQDFVAVASPRFAQLPGIVQAAFRRQNRNLQKHKIFMGFRDSRERYRKLIDTLADLVFTTNSENVISYANSQCAAFTGTDELKAKGTPFLEWVVAGERAKISDYLKAVERSEKPSAIETQFVKPGGTTLPVELKITLIRNMQGKMFGKIGVARDISERKQKEKRLLEQQKIMDAIINHAPLGIWMTDPQGKALLTNPAFEQYKQAEEQEVQKILSAPVEEMQPEKPLFSKERIALPQGKHRVLELIKTKVQGNAKNTLGVVGIAIDVSEKQQALKALKKSEKQFREMFKQHSAVMYLLDTETDGKIIDANAAAASFYGYSIEKLKEMKISDLNIMPPEQIRHEMTKIKEQGIKNFVFQHRLKSGEVRDVEIFSSPVSYYGKKLLFSIVYDVTENKKAQQAQKESEEKFSKAFQVNPAGMAISTLEKDKLIDINQSFLNKLGYRREEIIGKTFLSLDMFPSSKQATLFRTRLFEQGSVRNQQQSLKTKDGTEIIGLFSGEKISINGVPSLLITMNDITELKESEQKIRQQYSELQNTYEELGATNEELLVTTEELANSNAELRRLTAELKASQKELDLFFAYSKEGFFFMMLDKPIAWNENADKQALIDYAFQHHKITKVNQAMIDQYGGKPEDFIGKTPADFFEHHPQAGRKIWYDFFQQGSKEFITEERKFNGEQMWIEGTYQCFYDEQGRITGHFGVQREITDRIEMQKALKESEEKFRLIFDRSDDPFLIIENEKFIDCNEAAVKMLEVQSKSQIIGQTPLHFSAERQPDGKKSTKKATEYIKTALENKYHRFEWVHKKATGDDIYVDVSLTAININNLPVLLVVWRDITQAKLAQQALAKSEKRFRDVVEAAGEYIWETDTNGRYTYLTKQIENILGYTHDELLAKTPFDFMPPKEQKREWLRRQIQHGIRFKNLEHKSLTKNGKIVWQTVTGIPTFDAQGTMTGFRGVGMDISKRKEAIEKITQARKMAEHANLSKSEFLANISHEIRTPMNAILGFSEILLNKNTDPEQQNYLKTIVSSGKALLALINDILDLSKIEAGRLEIKYDSMELAAIFEEIRHIFSQKIQKKGIEFNIHISKDMPPLLLLDEVRLRQIIFNLVGNALKFTEKGFINLSAYCKNKTTDFIQLIIEVEDSGIGIAPKQHQVIFEAFKQQSGQSTRKYGGTGLGLAITKKLAEKMNGKILLESQLGKGSLFKVALEKVKIARGNQHKTQNKTSGSEEEVLFRQANLLVVDDVAFNRAMIVGQTENQNFNIVQAESAEEAIRLLRQQPFDLIFMDMRMGGISGFEATQKIKQNSKFKHIPIIAYTASAMKETEEKILKIFDGYLRKPVNKKDLFEQLKRFLPYKSTQTAPEKQKTDDFSQISDSEQIKALLKKLELIRDKQWEKIKDEIIIDQIEVFAENLNQVAQKYPAQMLSNYVSELKKDIQSFDVYGLESRLEQFPEIIQKLRQFLDSNSK